MEKKVKYLGGGWTDTESYILRRNVIVGNVYTVYRVDCDGGYWFLDGDGYHTCMKPIFFEDVVESPSEKFYKYFVIVNDKVDFKTNSFPDAESYQDNYGGFITQVLS